MKKFLVAPMMALALSLGATGGVLVPATSASARPASLKSIASKVTLEAVGGSSYSYWKKQLPKALDWRNNGCSVPDKVSGYKVADKYVKLFRYSCVRHDFGYRNHDRSGVSRVRVDDRFYSNMRRQCFSNYPRNYPSRVACTNAASLFHLGVRAGGGRYW